MALTSVETLLDFVDQRGFEYNDKIALRKIRNEIRKILRDSQKQVSQILLINKKMIICIVNILYIHTYF